MKTSLTTSDICKGLNIKFGRLREWLVHGYIKPSIPSPGQGQPAEFSLFDVYMIELFRHLTANLRLARDEAARCLSLIDKFKPVPGDFLVVARDGDNVKTHLVSTSVNQFLKLKVVNPMFEHPDPGHLVKVGEWDTVIIVRLEAIKAKVNQAFR